MNDITTHYVYGTGGLLSGEYDEAGNAIREYVYLNGEPLAQINADNSITYLHTDHLGTPRIGSDANGVQVWAWDSDAFGVGAATGNVTVPLRFAGQYYDDESGLHYNWNRYYNPETGRYISSDPTGLSGGLNTFAYVSANPIMYVDPEGLKSLRINPSRGERVRASSYNRSQARREARRQVEAIAELRRVQGKLEMTREELKQLIEEIYQNLIKLIEKAKQEGRLFVCLDKDCPRIPLEGCSANDSSFGNDNQPVLTDPDNKVNSFLYDLRCVCKKAIYID